MLFAHRKFPATVLHLAGLILVVLLSACSSSPPPEVATQYANRFGATKTATFGKCPELNGVWNLGAPSGGSVVDTEGKWLQGDLVPHFRWAGRNLFGLTPGLKGVIAASPRFGVTLFFSDTAYTEASPMPRSARGSMAYSELAEADFPCAGAGWRKGPSRNHSTNDAAARVLGLNPDRAVSISQNDYMALGTDGALLVATHIDYQGTNNKGAEVRDSYWHFLKLPRLADDAAAAGYSSN